MSETGKFETEQPALLETAVAADETLGDNEISQTPALDDEQSLQNAALDDERPTSRSDAKDPWHGLNDFDED